MRTHKDGFLQCRSLTVDLPESSYRRATNTYRYLSEGIEAEVENYLGVVLTGAETFRKIGTNKGMVTIQIDSNWVQPTRA